VPSATHSVTNLQRTRNYYATLLLTIQEKMSQIMGEYNEFIVEPGKRDFEFIPIGFYRLPYLRWQELDGFDQQLGEH
jgi:hypothetical protein